VDTIKPEILSLSINDYDIYTSRSVLIDVLLDEEVDEFGYIDYLGRWRRLCSNCEDYTRTKSFYEGLNYVIFKAIDFAGNEREVSRVFYIDTKLPKVDKLYPYQGWANNEFTLRYDEDNPVLVTLFARKVGDASYSEYYAYDCPAGNNQYCSITATSPAWTDGDEVEFYFTILDIAGNEVTSYIETAVIDTVPPVIEYAYMQAYGYSGTSWKLYAGFDDYYYTEYMLNPPSIWRRISSNIQTVQRSIYAPYGDNELILRVTDDAGNVAETTLEWTR
jgi:hypothetical protein